MTTWAKINQADGTITDHGDTPDVPVGATVVLPDQLATIAAAAADGVQTRLVGGVVRIMPQPTPALADIAALRAAASSMVDQAAEVARMAFLTPGVGQVMEYEATIADAIAALADPSPQASAYPWIAAEQAALAAAGSNVSIHDVALQVKATRDQWQSIGVAIKQLRRSAKLRIARAQTGDEASAIVHSIAWPSP